MKRVDIKRRPLANSVIDALEPEDRDYQERDSTGLYLRVKRTGTKSWLLRYKRLNGKWGWKGLGGYPAISGKRARTDAAKLLSRAADGEDIHTPTLDKLTVSELSELFYTHKENQGKAENTLKSLRSLVDVHIVPGLGKKAIDTVTRLDCNNLIKALEVSGKLSTSNGVAKALRQMWSYGIASGYCDNNPASELRHISIGYTAKNHPYLLEKELPEFLRVLKLTELSKQHRVAIDTHIRTLARPQMTRSMEWSELDLEAGLWTVPAHKMKKNKEFISPLSTQVITGLKELEQNKVSLQYVFGAMRKTKHGMMSNAALNRIVFLTGYQDRVVPHGFRHTASTLLREHGWDKQLVEAQLAHAEGGIAGIYNKAQYIEKRRELVQFYSDYLSSLSL